MYIRETLAVISLITHPASGMATPAQSRTETVNNQNTPPQSGTQPQRPHSAETALVRSLSKMAVISVLRNCVNCYHLIIRLILIAQPLITWICAISSVICARGEGCELTRAKCLVLKHHCSLAQWLQGLHQCVLNVSGIYKPHGIERNHSTTHHFDMSYNYPSSNLIPSQSLPASSSSPSSANVFPPTKVSRILVAHVVCGALATLLLLPLGVLVPRYARAMSKGRWWFPLHMGVQLGGTALAIAALAIGYQMGAAEGTAHPVSS
jgi:hypothetical protein